MVSYLGAVATIWYRLLRLSFVHYNAKFRSTFQEKK